MLAYLRHAEGYYVKAGKQTSEVGVIKIAMGPLTKMFGRVLCREFDAKKLKLVRGEMVKRGWIHKSINAHVGRIKRAFRWGHVDGLLPADVLVSLGALPGLRAGQEGVATKAPIRPVVDADVDAIQEHVSRQVWAMIELQRLTGCRPGEVVIMRPCDVDRSGDVWTFTPAAHKTEHHGKARSIFLGPKAQAVLLPWLLRDATAHCFSPAESRTAFDAERRMARRTRMTPSQLTRNRKARPKRAPLPRYTVHSYGRAIRNGCDAVWPTRNRKPSRRMNPPQFDAPTLEANAKRHWHPNQLRHTRLTEVRRQFGLEAAQTVGGHSRADVTQVYAERDFAKAAEVAKQSG